jgi:hypothetical protein
MRNNLPFCNTCEKKSQNFLGLEKMEVLSGKLGRTRRRKEREREQGTGNRGKREGRGGMREEQGKNEQGTREGRTRNDVGDVFSSFSRPRKRSFK